MTEARIGHLYKISSLLASSENRSAAFLRSYYLMRCKEITKGYGLPERQFSTKTRCPHCCLEWKKGTNVKVRSIKLSNRQKKRIRCIKLNKDNCESIKQKKQLLYSNEMEQICSFCKHSTITPLLKPNRQAPETSYTQQGKDNNKEITQEPKLMTNMKKKKKIVPKSNSNVYSNTFNVFSLNNKNNTIASTIKVEPKIIKNNKKKKDKFAGLCQQAVLASAKLKDHKDKQNKLNLFLKPSK